MQNIFKHKLKKNDEDVINIISLKKRCCNSIVEDNNYYSHGNYHNKCEDGKHIHNPISSQAYCNNYWCTPKLLDGLNYESKGVRILANCFFFGWPS